MPSAFKLKANVGEDYTSEVLHEFGYSTRKGREGTLLASQSDSGRFIMGSEFRAIEKEHSVSKMQEAVKYDLNRSLFLPFILRSNICDTLLCCL